MTVGRGDDRGDDLRKAGRPPTSGRSGHYRRRATASRGSACHAQNSLATRMIASAEAGGLTRGAAHYAATTAARPSQERGRERPHPPLAVVAPQPLRGVAHALRVAVSYGGGSMLNLASATDRIRRRIVRTTVAECSGQLRLHSRPDLCGRMLALSASSDTADQVTCRRSSTSRRSRLSILERDARASSLGAPRRPIRAPGLTRARLALPGQLRDGRLLIAAGRSNALE